MTAPLVWLWLACQAGGEREASGERGEHEEGEAHGGKSVSLGPSALENARLTVQELALVPLDASVSVPARIALDPRREAQVSAVTSGAVERIHVRPGDIVSAGHTLATVLSPELGAAIGAHLSATAKLETARARRDRVSSLHNDGFSAKSQLLDAEAELTVALAEAEAAEERLRVFGVSPSSVRPEEGQHFSSRFSVRSPIEGEVLAVQTTLGKSVASGESLFHVGDLREVWLVIEVSERNLAEISTGAQVSFTVDAYGPERFLGTVDQIGGIVDPVSRTVSVRVIVANADKRLKPNMFARAELQLASGPVSEGLVLPAEAVQIVEGKPHAFVQEEAGRFRAVPVRAERLSDGRQHILEGLAPGERVVVGGAFTLKSELGKGELGEGHAH